MNIQEKVARVSVGKKAWAADSVVLLALKPMENGIIVAANNALTGFGNISKQNIAFNAF